MPLQQQVAGQYVERFGGRPEWIVRAPGRVNLIGEHTDYNDGFVLPMAINRAVWIAAAPRADRRVVVYSLDYRESFEFDLATLNAVGADWFGYVQAVALALAEAGHRLHGWQGTLAGDVPIGAGLSSSAALELAVARAFAAASNLPWAAAAMAKIGQRAENRWVGVQCGIMDQMISAAGKAGHALLIDCRSLETQDVPLPVGSAIVVLDTGKRRGLVDSAYNERRAHCETTAQFFGATALRDVTADQFQARADGLDAVTRRRARHVITENARTLQAVEAMRRGDARALGQLMNASHASLRDDFEVSSPELDAIVRCARGFDGCYGARMTGGGFGGCAVALVRAEVADAFAVAVAAAYQQATGIAPQVYICQPTDGAAVISNSDRT